MIYRFLLVFFVLLFARGINAQSESREIRGMTGGEKNSGDCGFIADKPNHILQLPQKVYSLSITVEAEGGKPSLLVIGPTDKERFCVLGDTTLGRKPEIKGVWLPGRYLIYVGEMEGNRYPFTLRINQ
ncbi:MAG: hypothetical protein NZ901_06260 [Geminocystis sp.]|nr:hypothetical protein [Geminocystis sp.]MCX8079198.1 hypothetical protein [Geminocystis sp.]HIK38437.1 hypothetical protein [Geminocystis sp. M7585_C2015_104]